MQNRLHRTNKIVFKQIESRPLTLRDLRPVACAFPCCTTPALAMKTHVVEGSTDPRRTHGHGLCTGSCATGMNEWISVGHTASRGQKLRRWSTEMGSTLFWKIMVSIGLSLGGRKEGIDHRVVWRWVQWNRMHGWMDL